MDIQICSSAAMHVELSLNRQAPLVHAELDYLGLLHGTHAGHTCSQRHLLIHKP